MDIDLGSLIVGVMLGMTLIPLWKISSAMCNQKETRNKKKDKYKKKKGFPYKRKVIRNETKN